MHDFSILAASVNATRLATLKEAQHERDRAHGLASLRPAIDLLEQRVEPILEAAKAALAGAGVRLTIDRGWSEDYAHKAATLTIVASAAGEWAPRASDKRGYAITLGVADGEIVFHRKRPGADDAMELLQIEAGADPAAVAVAAAVDSMLARIDEPARMVGAVMQVRSGRDHVASGAS